MRLLLKFFKAIVRSRELKEENAQAAAESLEDAISTATELDGAALLSLSPESIAQVLRVTDVDPNVVQFVARSMLLESVYLNDAASTELASLRAAQAHAIAVGYGFALPPDPSDFQSITEGLEEAALSGGFDEVADDPFEGLFDDFTFLS